MLYPSGYEFSTSGEVFGGTVTPYGEILGAFGGNGVG